MKLTKNELLVKIFLNLYGTASLVGVGDLFFYMLGAWQIEQPINITNEFKLKYNNKIRRILSSLVKKGVVESVTVGTGKHGSHDDIMGCNHYKLYTLKKSGNFHETNKNLKTLKEQVDFACNIIK